ncbi:hypothetical protein L210DRAFT_3505767 [Boletus edulis BED1]|uniref:Uncharacterized protein n=1 Tax=Boletus edulis BED1 TaxID=1328754 RepID=A0AAD4BPZ6_BOLED|nr:hypothetical protein L210DRAFT_3505767 [Boletus edulis BED1]
MHILLLNKYGPNVYDKLAANHGTGSLAGDHTMLGPTSRSNEEVAMILSISASGIGDGSCQNPRSMQGRSQRDHAPIDALVIAWDDCEQTCSSFYQLSNFIELGD